MNSVMEKRDILKKIAASVATILCLSAVLGLIFRDNLADIFDAFKVLSWVDILCLLGMGVSYQLLDGLACLILVRTVNPAFSYRQSLEVIYLGVFGKMSTFGAGTIPMQACHLHRCGVEIGQGVGIMTFSYVLHKGSILLYASVLLRFEGAWVRSALPSLHSYLIAGYLLCLAIIGGLLLLCTWDRAHGFALWLVAKIPDPKGTWAARKQAIQQQLNCLHRETTAILRNKKVVLLVTLTHLSKLAILCAVPCASLRILGENSISPLHGELLTALLLLLASVVPNVAGIGPTEAVFLLIFSPLLGSTVTMSALLLFRIATYYMPFITSIAVFLTVRIKVLAQAREKAP